MEWGGPCGRATCLGNLKSWEGHFLYSLDCDKTAPNPSQSLSFKLTVLPNR